jgi:peroxiredoxin family protein
MSTSSGLTDLTHSRLKIGALLPTTVIMATIISDPGVAAASELALLRARVDALESQARSRREPEGLSLLVFSGELDKLLAAFTMAAGAAACGMRVSMFFTFWGAAGLKKSGPQAAHKSLVEKIFGLLLPGGLTKRKLSRLDMGGIGRAIVSREMRLKQIPDLASLIEMAAESGVELHICEMSMHLMGVRQEELIDYPGIKVCGVAHFLDLAANSRATMFI